MAQSKKTGSEKEKKPKKKSKIELMPLERPKIPHNKNKTIVLTEAQVKKIEYMAGLGMKMEDISYLCDFGRSTLYNLCDRDDQVLDAIKRGKAKAASAVAQTLYQMATSGKNTVATLFWLKTQQKWREVHPEDQKQTHEVIFATRIGDKGQILTEQIEDGQGTDRDKL